MEPPRPEKPFDPIWVVGFYGAIAFALVGSMLYAYDGEMMVVVAALLLGSIGLAIVATIKRLRSLSPVLLVLLLIYCPVLFYYMTGYHIKQSLDASFKSLEVELAPKIDQFLTGFYEQVMLPNMEQQIAAGEMTEEKWEVLEKGIPDFLDLVKRSEPEGERSLKYRAAKAKAEATRDRDAAGASRSLSMWMRVLAAGPEGAPSLVYTFHEKQDKLVVLSARLELTELGEAGKGWLNVVKSFNPAVSLEIDVEGLQPAGDGGWRWGFLDNFGNSGTGVLREKDGQIVILLERLEVNDPRPVALYGEYHLKKSR